MGEPNVFKFTFSWFIGVGVWFESYNGHLDLALVVPFCALSIYFHKSKDNDWI